MSIFPCGDDLFLIDAECSGLFGHAIGDAGVGFRAVHKIESEVIIASTADDMEAVAVAVIGLRKAAGTQFFPIWRRAKRGQWQQRDEREDADSERSRKHRGIG